jgi:hypothetical protein
MALTPSIRIKRRSAGGAAGAPASLQQAELAYNETDNTVYIGVGTGGAGGSATSIVPVAGAGAFVDNTSAQTVAGVKTFTASPLAPTPTNGDSSTKVATTEFVASAVGAAGGNQAPNSVYAGPASGGTAAAPSFRSLVAADIPSIPSSKLSDLGAANGAASLDGSGKVPTSQLPASVLGSLNYKGTFSAAGGSYPASPAKGDYYVISVAGTISGHAYAVDWITYDGTTWDYVDNSTKVSSVFGRTGAIVAVSGDYNTDQVTEGSTNLYFLASRVLAVVLSGLSVATSSAISATDSVIVAFGKLQAQITSLTTTVSSNFAASLQKANNLSDLASASTARTNLGLGTMATQSAASVSITGGTIDNVTITNTIIDGGTY